MRNARAFTHLLCGQVHVRKQGAHDEAIAQLARRQHGIVARRQLLDLGVSQRAIEHRIAVGRLRRVHAGVYAVGHDALPYAARVLAAVISVAPGAAASHLGAAALWELCDPRTDRSRQPRRRVVGRGAESGSTAPFFRHPSSRSSTAYP